MTQLNSSEPAPHSTEDSPTELSQETRAGTIAQARRPRSKRPWLILMAALLIGSGVAAFWLNASRSNSPSSSSAESQPSQTTSVPKKSTQTDLKMLMSAVQAHMGGGNAEAHYTAPDYRVAGYDFYAAGILDKSVSWENTLPEAEVKPAVNTLEAYVLEKGFKKSEQQVKEAYYPLVKYENTDTLCGINYYLDTADTKKPLFLTCALKSTYEPTANIQKPFYDVYRQANKDSQYLTEDSRLGLPKIIDSQTAGYKTAEAAIYGEASPTGAMGLFYQTPDEMWHYFTGTQSVIPCKEYSTVDLKKAYLGQKCYLLDDAGTESSVKL